MDKWYNQGMVKKQDLLQVRPCSSEDTVRHSFQSDIITFSDPPLHPLLSSHGTQCPDAVSTQLQGRYRNTEIFLQYQTFWQATLMSVSLPVCSGVWMDEYWRLVKPRYLKECQLVSCSNHKHRWYYEWQGECAEPSSERAISWHPVNSSDKIVSNVVPLVSTPDVSWGHQVSELQPPLTLCYYLTSGHHISQMEVMLGPWRCWEYPTHHLSTLLLSLLCTRS